MSARARVTQAAVYIAAWVPVVLGYALALATGNALTWPAALTAALSSTIPAAIAALGVIMLCHHVPLRGRVPQTLLVHAAGAMAFTVVWSAAIVSEIWLTQRPEVVTDFFRNGLAWQLVTGLMVYAGVAGSTYARIAFRGEDEQRAASQRSETLRLRAELAAIRARLDPHFLFNVLQTLNALIPQRPQDAQRAIELLAALLNRRLREGGSENLARFSDELTDVREFLALESLRLGNRLRVEERVAPETLDFLWPRFSLQPLVENAVEHGIAPRAQGGCIVITSDIQDGRWRVTIADDGRGGDPDRMFASKGIGLPVVRDRLRLHFGDRATMQIHSAPDAGCAVSIAIDRATEDRDDE